MTQSEFVHLHGHSEYSLLDGGCRVAEMAELAADLGMPALAITDHGNLFGYSFEIFAVWADFWFCNARDSGVAAPESYSVWSRDILCVEQSHPLCVEERHVAFLPQQDVVFLQRLDVLFLQQKDLVLLQQRHLPSRQLLRYQPSLRG